MTVASSLRSLLVACLAFVLALPALGAKTKEPEFKVALHCEMPCPRPGLHSHHGVMSKWMQEHYANYDPLQAPAVLMPAPKHELTFGVFNKWRSATEKKMGGTFDWAKVPEPEIRKLSETMFDAAHVPASIRKEYWQGFDQLKKRLTLKKSGRGK